MVPRNRKKKITQFQTHQLMRVSCISSCESLKHLAFLFQQVQNFNAQFCTENSTPGGKHLLKHGNTKCDNNLGEI